MLSVQKKLKLNILLRYCYLQGSRPALLHGGGLVVIVN